MIFRIINSLEFEIDDEDFLLVSQYNWTYYNSTGVVSYVKRKVIHLHRLLMNCLKGLVVDHIDHNKKNNKKQNLRICTQEQNLKNQKKPKSNTSGFKGVVFDNWGFQRNLKKCWVAQIRVDYKNIKLGRFLTKLEAALMYDTAARHYFGDFADVNFKP